MKTQEKEYAIQLRRDGLTYRQILEQVPVSRSTLSQWLRTVELEAEQADNLAGIIRAGRAKCGSDLRAERRMRWESHHAEAAEEFESLRSDVDFMFGLGLYVGEGTKAIDSQVAITNADPGVIRKSLCFLSRFGPSVKCAVFLHPEYSNSADAVKQYWSEITGLTEVSVTWVQSKSTQNKKVNYLPNGTCRVYFYSTEIKQKMIAWMKLALE